MIQSHLLLGRPYPSRVVPDDVPKRLGPIRNALEAAKHSGRANGLRNELAQLTNPWDLHEQLVQVEERRLNVCRGLFEGLWKARIRQASARVREAAGIYQNAIDGLVRGRGSAAGALKQVPKVLEMFPVWGVTNLSARVNFPLSKAIFDLVVIDEASQCDIPSAIPLLFRARKALIIGDPNQLIHVTPLRPTRDSELAQRHGLEEEVFLRFGYRARSLFNLASDRIGQDPVFLDHHFRSHPSIITFSNDEIYGSRLTILSDARSETPGPPVCWINVRGEFRRGRRGSALNPPEVAQVASEIGQLWAQLEGLGLTLGVVTPFRAHAEAIRQQVAEQVPQVLEHLVVATADRFQGDERDVMIFSPTVSNDMPEFHKTFASDRNRVNVAVTRARKRLMVIGDRQACLDTPGLIGALARYVADLEEKKFESPLERRLWEALRSQGITAKPGVLVDGYRLDLAVELGAVRLDIECDGAAFHKDLRSDQTRDLALTKDGWTILRLSGREILHNIDGCVSEVLRILEGGQ